MPSSSERCPHPPKPPPTPPPPHPHPHPTPPHTVQTLAGINPDVALESYTMNITTLEGFDAFKASLTAPGSDGAASRVDLVLSCVDNYEARMTINQARAAAGQAPMQAHASNAWLRGVPTSCMLAAARCIAGWLQQNRGAQQAIALLVLCC